GTGAILDRFAAGPPATSGPPERLTVVHVRTLPPGWLGKCHAAHVGAQQARGAFLLFMDGDVDLAAPDLLERILTVVRDMKLDHLAIFPDLRPVGALQAGVVHAFEQGMLLAIRGWEMEADRSAGGGGIGAFNLVRRATYDAVGGYDRLRMEIADDFKLGLLLRRAGARQRIWSGLDLVRCPWHRGAFAVLRGLEKNLFAGAEYSLARLVLYTVVVLAMECGPLAVALAGGGFVPLAVQVASILAAATSGAWRLGRSPWLLAALQPIATLLMTGAFWNSAIRTLAQGGVRWRDTFYPLAELKRGIVR
ncbi:MAG TPA: glycosyltransferase, partial [Dongiaceae bacterium]|nr:glycosyltransferase [Dongiaceae bacterium]